MEKTVVWENERWSLTSFFDGVWTLKNKGKFTLSSAIYPELDIALDYEEISELREILGEVSLSADKG